MQKTLKWMGIAALVLVVLPLGVVIAINAFDEKPNPWTASLGVFKPSAVPEAENAYVALIAMAAGDGADGAAYAREWLAEERAAARERRAPAKIVVKRARRPEICDPAQVSCLTVVRDAPADMDSRLHAYKEDLDRYEKLIALRAYREILDYPFRLESQFPSYLHLAAAQRAYLARAAQKAHAGKIADALSDVERDIAFQRVMLDGAGTLVGKMVAVAHYMRDLAFVTDLLQTHAAGLRAFVPRLREMLKPIAPAALQMDEIIDSEYGFMAQALKNPAAGGLTAEGRWLDKIATRFFYQPNATLNKLHEQYLQTAGLLRQPPAALAFERDHPAVVEEWKLRDTIHNPMGKVMLQTGMPSFVPYALRLVDLDACNRLVGLGVEVLAANLRAPDVANGVAELAAKSDARFHDPYSGKPMTWDAGSSQLSFRAGAARGARKVFNLERGRLFIRL